LKTNLDLRPVYHKSDAGTLTHLHLGLLAYWIVNTVKCKTKAHGINSQWNEIVRIGNTQKIITAHGSNTPHGKLWLVSSNSESLMIFKSIAHK